MNQYYLQIQMSVWQNIHHNYPFHVPSALCHLTDDITLVLAIGNNLISEKLTARVIQDIIHNRGDDTISGVVFKYLREFAKFSGNYSSFWE